MHLTPPLTTSVTTAAAIDEAVVDVNVSFAVYGVPSGSVNGDNETNPSYRLDFKGKSNLEVLITTFSGIANLLIFFLIVSNKRFRRRTNFLIANLCLASVSYIAALNFRIVAPKFLDIDVDVTPWCGVMAVLHRFAIPVMSLTTMAISLERSRSAVATNPQQLLPSKAFASLKLVLIWSLSILITIPTAFMHVDDVGLEDAQVSTHRCKKVLLCNSIWMHALFVILHTTIVYIVPAVVLVFELLRMQKKITFLVCKQKPGISCKNNERLRLVRNSSIFTALFIVCWLPIGCWMTIYDLPSELFSYDWRSDYSTLFYLCHLLTNYFIWSIPGVLFLISQNLRETFCQCAFCAQFCQWVERVCPLIPYCCCCFSCSTPANSVSRDLELQSVAL